MRPEVLVTVYINNKANTQLQHWMCALILTTGQVYACCITVCLQPFCIACKLQYAQHQLMGFLWDADNTGQSTGV